MKATLFSAVLAASLAASLAAAASLAHAHGRDRDDYDGPPVAVARGAFLQDVNAMLEDTREIAEHSDDAWGKRDRREMHEHLADLQQRLQALRDELDEAPVVRPGTLPPPPPPPPPAGPMAMDPARFNTVLASIRGAYYTNGKFVVLQDVARENYFTVDQVIAVMAEMYWTDDKVKAAAMLYPRVVDRSEWFRVYGGLYFDSDKQKLRDLCGS